MRSEAYTWFVRGAAWPSAPRSTIAILYALLQAAEVVVLVFLALLLASGAEPLIDQVRSRSRLGRGATLLLTYFVIFGAIAVLALLIVPAAITQFSTLGDEAHALARQRARVGRDDRAGRDLGRADRPDRCGPGASWRRQAPPPAPEPDQIIAVGLTFAELVISLISLLALIYFWLTERARLQRFVLALLPADRRSGTRDAWNQIELHLGSAGCAAS